MDLFLAEFPVHERRQKEGQKGKDGQEDGQGAEHLSADLVYVKIAQRLVDLQKLIGEEPQQLADPVISQIVQKVGEKHQQEGNGGGEHGRPGFC